MLRVISYLVTLTEESSRVLRKYILVVAILSIVLLEECNALHVGAR